jgi:hypothetical protein
MREELDSLLCQKYPKMFVNRNKSMQETCMYWGFECSDGWFDLIDKLCESIQSYIDNNSHAPDRIIPQVTVDQVKEKFGTLRFYTTGGDRLIDGMIWFAESMSGRICETCGAPGETRGRGYIYTACNEHAKEGDKDDNLSK